MTKEELATNAKTFEHIMKVRDNLNVFIAELLKRGERHDQSKLVEPELAYMVAHTDKLEGTTFGSPEYLAGKALMKPALDHHYAVNRHHPEHHKNGVNDMTIVDLLEMFADWKASSERHNDGNLRKSIEYNAIHFNMSMQLTCIFVNTMEQMF